MTDAWPAYHRSRRRRARRASRLIQLYKRTALIHAGRVVRIDTPDDTAWMHGVVAADASAALMSYVQLESPQRSARCPARPRLDRRRRYQSRR